MNVVDTRRIGTKKRPDQNHGRARGADDAGNQRPEGKDAGIDERRAAERAGDENAAGHHIEREQDGDEAEIVAKERMRQAGKRGVGAAQRPERHNRQHRPEEGELAIMMMPDAGE